MTSVCAIQKQNMQLSHYFKPVSYYSIYYAIHSVIASILVLGPFELQKNILVNGIIVASFEYKLFTRIVILVLNQNTVILSICITRGWFIIH